VTLVPDATVVVKWFVPEVATDAARALLDSGNDFAVPDLLFGEIGGILRWKVRREEMTEDEAAALLHDVMRIPFDVASSRELAGDALAIALRINRGISEATYIALAVRLETVVVTADDRLIEALRPFPLAAAHVWHVARPGV